MALIHCNECGKEISDQASICPNCGVKTQTWLNNQQQKKNKRKRIWYFILIGFLILVALGGFGLTFVSIDQLIRDLKWDNVYPWWVISTILSIVGSGFCCWFISRKRTVKIKGIILAVYGAYMLGALVYFGIGLITEVKPCWDFQKLYANKNAIENLQDKEISWGDIKLTFDGNDITFVGKDNQVTLPIDTIDEQGWIRVTVTPEQLVSVFDDFEKYFEGKKESDKWYDIDKYTSHLYLIPSPGEKLYDMSYVGYYAKRPEITYKGNLGTASLYGLMYGIQEGAYMAAREATNSLRYDDSKAGIVRFTEKYDNRRGYVQPRTTTKKNIATEKLEPKIQEKENIDEVEADSIIVVDEQTVEETSSKNNESNFIGKYYIRGGSMTYVIQINQDKTVILQDEEGESDWYFVGHWEPLKNNSEIQVKIDGNDYPLFSLPKGKEVELSSFILSKDGYIYNPKNPNQKINFSLKLPEFSQASPIFVPDIRGYFGKCSYISTLEG